MKVGVIGVGKLGLPLAVCFAEAGCQVVGFDKNQSLISSLNSGSFYTHEPKVIEMLGTLSIKENVQFTNRSEDLETCDLVYIIVPTPSNESGFFDAYLVESAVSNLVNIWEDLQEEKTVVIVSTVMPGTTAYIYEKYLRETKIKLLYSPEFIALGTVVNNLKEPDAILVGCSHILDAESHVTAQKMIAGDTVPVSFLSWDEAEVVKLLVNCYVTMKISFANFIGEICDVIPGARPEKIAKALGADSRIGNKYLNPGLGYAGPCFPRDNAALSSWSSQKGLKADLAFATQSINERQPQVTFQRIKRLIPQNSSILVIGLVYKPKTEVMEHSQSLELVRLLASQGHTVRVFEPYVLSQVLETQFNIQVVQDLANIDPYELILISPGFESLLDNVRHHPKVICL